MSQYRAVLPNQFWTGTDGCSIRVIAAGEKYAMVRRKGCVPFVLSERELRELYTLDSQDRTSKTTSGEVRHTPAVVHDSPE